MPTPYPRTSVTIDGFRIDIPILMEKLTEMRDFRALTNQGVDYFNTYMSMIRDVMICPARLLADHLDILVCHPMRGFEDIVTHLGYVIRDIFRFEFDNFDNNVLVDLSLFSLDTTFDALESEDELDLLVSQ